MSSFHSRLTLGKAVLTVLLRRGLRGPRHPNWSVPFEVGVHLCGATLDRPGQWANGRFVVPAGRRTVSPIPGLLRSRVSHATTTLAGMAAEVHTPRTPAPGQPTTLFLHGGGYFTCSPASHRALAARISVASGARTVLPDYRKAPEHPFPAAIDDSERAYDALLASGEDPTRMFVMGDSAGGGLALALVQRLRARVAPLPRALVLLSPMVDLNARTGSMQTNRAFDYLPTDDIEEVVSQYLGGADPSDPLASPVCADLSGLPPILMLTGELELFLDQNLDLAQRARASGGEVIHIVAPDMVHVYPLLADVSERARGDIKRIGQFVRDACRHGGLP